MISEEDKLEIRSIALRELREVVSDITHYAGDTGSMNDGSKEARVIAPTILRVIADRARRLESEKDDLRRRQSQEPPQ